MFPTAQSMKTKILFCTSEQLKEVPEDVKAFFLHKLKVFEILS